MNARFRDFGLSWQRIGVFAALTILTAFFESFGMAMFMPVIDYMEKGRTAVELAGQSRLWGFIVGGFNALEIEVTLVSLLLVVLGLIIVRIGLVYCRQIYSSWFTQNVLHTTRGSLFSAYIRAEFSLFDKLSTGTVVNRVTTETERLGNSFHGLVGMISNAIVVMGFMVVLFWISPTMTMVAMGFVGLAVGVTLYAVRRTKGLSRAATGQNIVLANELVERLTNMRIIKTAAVEERENRYVLETSNSIRGHLFNLARLTARIDLLMEPIVVVCGLFLVYFGFRHLQLSIAEIGLFMLILLRLLPLGKELMRSRQTFLSGIGSWETVLQGLAEARQAEERSGGSSEFSGLSEGVRFNSVGYTYPAADRPAIADITLLFPAGKVTALVGPSGSGKSTLVDLLPLLKKPQKGKIYFDGVDSALFDLGSLRRGIAFVTQESFILNDTVRANMLFFKQDAGDDEIRRALDKAKALEFVESLPQGLDTMLGERGAKLSGGQKQRLSLARAWLQDAPILILDEPTSALDSETERDVQASMAELRERSDKTIIIIAHRMSTIRNADKIVVLREGRIVQEGSHQDLMSSPEWYALASELQNE